MTEAGEKWVVEVLGPIVGDELLKHQFAWCKETDLILRAFVAEVEKRLNQSPYFGAKDTDGLAEVFTELTRELLGDHPPRSAA